MLSNPKVLPLMKKLAQELIKKTTHWENTTFYDRDLSGVVKKLKRQKAADIVIMGSGSLVQQLTKEGLIDEYAFIVTPIMAGEGQPLFQDASTLKVELLSTKHFTSGNVLPHFRAA